MTLTVNEIRRHVAAVASVEPMTLDFWNEPLDYLAVVVAHLVHGEHFPEPLAFHVVAIFQDAILNACARGSNPLGIGKLVAEFVDAASAR